MEIKASLNYLRIAPRKVRLVADLIRGMEVNKAQSTLKFTKKRAAAPILKLLNSAIASAKKNFNLTDEQIQNLYIKKINVDEGPKFKRWMPVSRGTAHEIQKKTSHIILILDEKPKQETKIIKNQIVGKTKQSSKVKHE